MSFDENRLFEILMDRDVDKAREYMSLYIPDYLSKFYSLTDDEDLNNKKLETLAKNCNWFDYACNQNDPFDMRMVYVDEEKIKESGLPHEAYIWEKQFLDGIKNRMLLCSFVDSDYNNLPMWAYYANNHRGYCVRYKINRKEIFFRVLYAETSAPVTNYFLQYKLLCDKEKDNNKVKNGQAVFEYVIELLLSTKHLSWKHEKEYRIICPYYEKIGNRIDNQPKGLEISDITIGLNCTCEYRQKIIQIATSRNIPCYQICLDNKNFLSRNLIGGK